jgi:hypothetical protein
MTAPRPPCRCPRYVTAVGTDSKSRVQAPAGHTDGPFCVEEPASKEYLPPSVVGTSTVSFEPHLGSSIQGVLWEASARRFLKQSILLV